MAVSASSGQSALADLHEVKRAVHSLFDYVNKGPYSDIERLVDLIEGLRLANKQYQLQLQEANREINELRQVINQQKTQEFAFQNEHKKLSKDHKNLAMRVQYAMSLMMNEGHLDSLPATHRQCFKDLSAATNNLSVAPAAAVTSGVSIGQPQQYRRSTANDLYVIGDESGMDPDPDCSWAPAGAGGGGDMSRMSRSRDGSRSRILDSSRTRSGKTYQTMTSTTTTTGVQQQQTTGQGAPSTGIVFPNVGFALRTGPSAVENASEQLPPRPPQQPANTRQSRSRRSQSTDMRRRAVSPTIPYIPPSQPETGGSSESSDEPQSPVVAAVHPAVAATRRGILGRRSRSDTRANKLAAEQPVTQLTRSPSSSLARPHFFVNETTMLTKTHCCVVCQKKSRFGHVMMRCQQCNYIVHPNCRNAAPTPCWGRAWNSPSASKLLQGKAMSTTASVAPTGTPTSASSPSSSGGPMLTSLVNELPPFVPPLVIQCVGEVETRGLGEAGLYRLSGSRSEVQALKSQLSKGKHPPVLANVNDIHVICCLLKDFLMLLPEPVIQRASRSEFLNALDLHPDDKVSQLKSLVKSLPDAHHDTLIFMMLHLQKVANSRMTQMPISSLARIFGPTLLGPAPGPATLTSQGSIRDVDRCAQVVDALLSIPADYWMRHLRVESDSLYHRRPSGDAPPPGPPSSTTSGTTTSASESGAEPQQNTSAWATANSSGASAAAGHAVRGLFSRVDSKNQPPIAGQLFSKKVKYTRKQ